MCPELGRCQVGHRTIISHVPVCLCTLIFFRPSGACSKRSHSHSYSIPYPSRNCVMTRANVDVSKRCSGHCALGSAIFTIITIVLGLQIKLSYDSRCEGTRSDYELGVRNASQYLRTTFNTVNKAEARGEDPIAPPKTLQRSLAHRCNNSTKEAPFLSQSGEDKYLLATFFSNVCGGSYIEIGALDGKKFSNSYYFNR